LLCFFDGWATAKPLLIEKEGFEMLSVGHSAEDFFKGKRRGLKLRLRSGGIAKHLKAIYE